MRKILAIVLLFSAVAGFAGFVSAAVVQFKNDLYFGLRNNEEVRNLQQFLLDQGVYNGPITGNFFSLTLQGVKNFQKRQDISPMAGYFGPKSRKAANDLLMKQAPVAQPVPAPIVPPVPAPAATSAPAAVLPNPFSSTLKIETISVPAFTLTTYGDKMLDEFKLSANEKIAITKIRFTNTGTFNNDYLINFRLVKDDTGVVVATADKPINGVVEFKLIANNAAANKGLVVSGNSYQIWAYILTPNYGQEKPKIRLDIQSAADVSAFDYNDLSRVADITQNNIFPIVGSAASAF